jgi:hypothetical protein
VARILPTLLVLALLGGTAGAFAVTEGLKLEKSPISDTKVSKTVAPDSQSDSKAAIQFFLRKPDRLTVEIVNGNSDVVRTLARSKRARRGTQLFTWNGRNDAGVVAPDGTYRPRVHLAAEHRTILLPNPIRMDATPPLVRLVSVTPHLLTPDGGGPTVVQVRYQTSERAKAILYVDGDPRITARRYLRAGKLEWRGRVAPSLRAGPHRLELRALDLATNYGPPSRALVVVVRYIELRPHVVRAKTGQLIRVRVLNASRYTVHLGSLHTRRSASALVLRAPKPGRYVLRVASHGHVAKAHVVVRP